VISEKKAHDGIVSKVWTPPKQTHRIEQSFVIGKKILKRRNFFSKFLENGLRVTRAMRILTIGMIAFAEIEEQMV